MSIVRTHQFWVSRNISKLKVSVLDDHLVSISWSVPVKASPSHTLRKESRVFDRNVPWWFFWNNNVSCVLFLSLISNSWSGFIIHLMDFCRTHRDRTATVIGSPWLWNDVLPVSRLMWRETEMAFERGGKVIEKNWDRRWDGTDQKSRVLWRARMYA